MKYYAFLEEIITSDANKVLLFDAVISEVVVGGKLQNDLQEVHTFQIEISVTEKELRKRYNKKKLMLDRWYILETSCSEDGISGVRFNTTDDQQLEIYVDSIKMLDQRNKLQKELMKSSSLDNLPDASINDVIAVLPKLGSRQNLIMKVMNVGQGNSVAFMDPTEYVDLFYVDVGGGVMRNRSTYKNVRYSPIENALVILTHWDMDHWVSLMRNPELEKTILLAPRQKPLGLSHIKLATKLHLAGRLLIWPNTVSKIESELIDIHKLKEDKNRNYSGLVVISKTDPNNRHKNVLITGDAPYKKCNFLVDYEINTVLVPHHGGKFDSDKVPNAPKRHIAIFSYGRSNSYGHPHEETIKSHVQHKWCRHYNTESSNIIVNNSSLSWEDRTLLQIIDFHLQVAKYF